MLCFESSFVAVVIFTKKKRLNVRKIVFKNSLFVAI